MPVGRLISQSYDIDDFGREHARRHIDEDGNSIATKLEPRQILTITFPLKLPRTLPTIGFSGLFELLYSLLKRIDLSL